MGLPGAILNVRQKIKNKNKIQIILNLQFCLSFKNAPDSLHFLILGTLKSYFLFVKTFLNFVLETLKIISYMFFFIFLYAKTFLNFEKLFLVLKYFLIFKISFYVLNNNLSYNYYYYIFFLQKIFYFDLNEIDPFFLFLLQKDFDTFHVLLFEAFLCILRTFINHFYVCLKFMHIY